MFRSTAWISWYIPSLAKLKTTQGGGFGRPVCYWEESKFPKGYCNSVFVSRQRRVHICGRVTVAKTAWATQTAQEVGPSTMGRTTQAPPTIHTPACPVHSRGSVQQDKAVPQRLHPDTLLQATNRVRWPITSGESWLGILGLPATNRVQFQTVQIQPYLVMVPRAKLTKAQVSGEARKWCLVLVKRFTMEWTEVLWMGPDHPLLKGLSLMVGVLGMELTIPWGLNSGTIKELITKGCQVALVSTLPLTSNNLLHYLREMLPEATAATTMSNRRQSTMDTMHKKMVSRTSMDSTPCQRKWRLQWRPMSDEIRQILHCGIEEVTVLKWTHCGAPIRTFLESQGIPRQRLHLSIATMSIATSKIVKTMVTAVMVNWPRRCHN